MEITMMVLSELVIPTLAAVLLALVPFAVRRTFAYFEKRFGIELDEKREYQLQEVLEGGILYAEQLAYKKAKAQEEKLSSDSKLSAAVDWAISEIKRRELDELGRERLVELIETKLRKLSAEEPEKLGGAVSQAEKE